MNTTITIDIATLITPDHGDLCGSLGMWMSEFNDLHEQEDEVDCRLVHEWTEHLEAKLELCNRMGEFLAANLEGGLPQ
tara:strand:+ start:49 stop:282 length:234 start_codon:yes stop_codon:yes gene_type:complete